MAKSGAGCEAADLRLRAETIGGASAPLERCCLEAGMRLSEAIPGLNEVRALFESLAQSLESKDIGGAIDDLDRIAGELAQSADDITEESQALAELSRMNGSVGGRLSILLTCLRTISSLVFSMKIEAAPLGASAEDLSSFADSVHQLSEHARRALNEYQSTYGRLDDLLRSSCDEQAQFQRRHQASLRSISAEIVDSLAAVAELRRQTLVALREIGANSRAVSDQISQCVVALQVGDSTRQRAEHVRAALDLSADYLAGGGALAATGSEGPFEQDAERVVSRLCRLQTLQLDAALQEFGHEIGTVSALLDKLGGAADALAQRGRALFGAGKSRRESFLEMVERKLAAAQAIVTECRGARAVVDRAASAVAETMDDLERRTRDLSEIVGDVAIIGTNALLKSTRLGDQGKGFTVIAHELREYSGQIASGIRELSPVLNEVAVRAKRVGEVGRNLDAGRLGSLDSRMSQAIHAFGANARQMTEALERLGTEAASVRVVLSAATATLAARDEIEPALRAACGDLHAIAESLDDGEQSPGVDDLLDSALRGAYSMASERQIHDAFTGYSGGGPTADAGEAEDLAAAFML